MIGLLQKIFVKNRGEAETRTAMGMLCGIVGIVLNVLLFAGKLIAGAVTHGRHGHRLSLARIFTAELLIKVFVNMGMNTAWSCMLYGKSFMAILPARAIANLIQLPMDTVIIYSVLLALDKARVLSKMRMWLKLASG